MRSSGGDYSRRGGGQPNVVQVTRGELDTVAAALDTTSEVLASRADLTPATRTALGLPALGEGARSSTAVRGISRPVKLPVSRTSSAV